MCPAQVYQPGKIEFSWNAPVKPGAPLGTVALHPDVDAMCTRSDLVPGEVSVMLVEGFNPPAGGCVQPDFHSLTWLRLLTSVSA